MLLVYGSDSGSKGASVPFEATYTGLGTEMQVLRRRKGGHL